MRAPLNWLREFVPVPAEHRAEDVMADLVRVGLEEEAVHRPGDDLQGPIVVGQVLSKEPEEQKNGKTINWCQVRVVPEGTEQTLTGEGIDPSGVQGIVCGAHNFEVGDKVVVTLPGAVLPGDFRISPRQTYGHVSAGMIASVRELGIGEDHDGILVLSTLGLDPELGADVREVLALDEEAAEINVTPDRGYVFSMRGVAREYAHATGVEFTDPAAGITVPAPTQTGWPVRLADDAPIYATPGCSRFVARTVSGVDAAAPTPAWMATRLRLAGIRSISLPVDISNYVMWELGQPLHFYDADALRGEIVVRRAAAGETLTTLDERERTLDPEDLLITDDRGPIGLAGVMGGAETEVSDATTRIVIESATFDPVSIARTRRRHRLPSEASKRNERGVDPRIADVAAQRAVQLLVELAGGTDEGAVTDVGEPAAPAAVTMDAAYPTRRVGVDYSCDEVVTTLRALGAEVEVSETDEATVLRVTPPSWRTDLTIPEDLVEEVARLRGYDQIPSVVPVAPPGRGLTRVQAQRRRVSQALADAGHVEVLNYPFVSVEQNRLFGAADADAAESLAMVALANPISSHYGQLRTTLLPGLVEAARRNLGRGLRDMRLYEVGRVVTPSAGQRLGSAEIPPRAEHPAPEVLEDLVTGVPDQPWHVGGVLAGHDSAPGPDHAPRAHDWQDAVSAALDVADLLGVELAPRQSVHQAFHPGRAAELVVRTADGVQVVGIAGELHPQWLETQDLPARMGAWVLDLDALSAAAPAVVTAGVVSTFPATSQDVALVVDADTVAGDVREALREGAGELLEEISLFDVYAGPGVPEGKKSLAFSLRFRATDRTLTADEASAARTAATQVALERFDAVQR
ncbi:MAG: phenylalanine--tRNA ligase subunit beta [Micrococcus sp.]|nr:phenylalanine--tRNA ligase subunit beta [Micrococcus sp.]